MARTSTRLWLWWATLVVYTLVGLAPARGLVLCIGEDGHFALEAASAQASCFDCPTESSQADACCANETSQGASCTCSDIQLPVENPKVARVLVLGLLEGSPPPCAWMHARLDFDAVSTPGLEFRARALLPASLRASSIQILRV